MDRDLVISIRTILFTAGLAFGLYLLYLVRPILVILALSTLIVISLEHAVQFVQEQKFMNKNISRTASVVLVYFFVIFLLITLTTIGFQPVISESRQLIQNVIQFVRAFFEAVPVLEQMDLSTNGLASQFTSISGNIFSTASSVVSSVAGILSVVIVSIYMSIDWPNIKRRLYGFFSGDTQKEVRNVIEEIEVSIGHWIKGQLTLMLIVGSLSFVGLLVLGVEFPLALALISGLTEIIPVLGPALALIFAGIVGFSQSATTGIAVVALYAFIQQLENNFLVPKVMHKVSGFSPLIILIGLLIGTQILGIIGAVIAVPVMMIFVIVLKHFLNYNPPQN